MRGDVRRGRAVDREQRPAAEHAIEAGVTDRRDRLLERGRLGARAQELGAERVQHGGDQGRLRSDRADQGVTVGGLARPRDRVGIDRERVDRTDLGRGHRRAEPMELPAGLGQLASVARLAQEAMRDRQRARRRVGFERTRQQHPRDQRRPASDLLEQLDPVHLRHPQIADHHHVRPVVELDEGLRSRTREVELEVARHPRQHAAEPLDDLELVIDQEDARSLHGQCFSVRSTWIGSESSNRVPTPSSLENDNSPR